MSALTVGTHAGDSRIFLTHTLPTSGGPNRAGLIPWNLYSREGGTIMAEPTAATPWEGVGLRLKPTGKRYSIFFFFLTFQELQQVPVSTDSFQLQNYPKRKCSLYLQVREAEIEAPLSPTDTAQL